MTHMRIYVPLPSTKQEETRTRTAYTVNTYVYVHYIIQWRKNVRNGKASKYVIRTTKHTWERTVVIGTLVLKHLFKLPYCLHLAPHTSNLNGRNEHRHNRHPASK